MGRNPSACDPPGAYVYCSDRPADRLEMGVGGGAGVHRPGNFLCRHERGTPALECLCCDFGDFGGDWCHVWGELEV